MQISKVQNDGSSRHRFEDDTPVSSIYDSTSRFNFKTNPKPEVTETRARASTNLQSLKHVKLDHLRNKLMNTEIQKEGALKMAETFREKYFKMQDLITTIIDKQAPSTGLPPDPVKKEKFIKTYKRFGIGPTGMKSGRHSHNNSINLESFDNSPPLGKPKKKHLKDSSEFGMVQMSRDNSRKRKNSGMNLMNSSFQGKLPELHDFENMDESINLYSKELQKR